VLRRGQVPLGGDRDRLEPAARRTGPKWDQAGSNQRGLKPMKIVMAIIKPFKLD